jgi:WD40 repeat protein
VGYSPDGKRIVSGGQGFDPKTRKSWSEMKVWDAATGKELLSLKGHTGYVRSVAYSPDGKRIVSGSGGFFRQLGEVKVWDAATGQLLLSLKDRSDGVNSVAYSPDGKRVASGGGLMFEGTVKVWDVATGQRPLSLK